jgi:hypothetical protein
MVKVTPNGSKLTTKGHNKGSANGWNVSLLPFLLAALF